MVVVGDLQYFKRLNGVLGLKYTAVFDEILDEDSDSIIGVAACPVLSNPSLLIWG